MPPVQAEGEEEEGMNTYRTQGYAKLLGYLVGIVGFLTVGALGYAAVVFSLVKIIKWAWTGIHP